jgi:hypothetical protein
MSRRGDQHGELFTFASAKPLRNLLEARLEFSLIDLDLNEAANPFDLS